jgi:tetratricopeptide (TPR) repeat protein
VLIVGFATPALAQMRARWPAPYDLGLKAYSEGNWEEAIAQLEKAVGFDSRPDPIKYVEGTDRRPYFPYVYLAVAHLQLNRLQKAQEYFQKSDDLETKLPKNLADLKAQSKRDLAARLTPPPPKPDGNPEFDQKVRQMEASAAAGRFDDALQDLAALEAMDRAEFARRNLSARRTDISRSRAGEIVRDASQLLRDLKLNAAEARFDEADRVSPGINEAAEGKAAIKLRRLNYARLAAAWEGDVQTGLTPDAIGKLKSARAEDPDQFKADGLEASLNLLEKMPAPQPGFDAPTRSHQAFAAGRALAAQGRYAEAEVQYQAALVVDPNNAAAAAELGRARDYAAARTAGQSFLTRRKFVEARQQLQTAQLLDPARFTRDRLETALTTIEGSLGAASPSELAALALRGAVAAYLEGDSPRAIKMLEAAQIDRVETGVRADVQACLGVAYASRAFTARTVDERASFRDRALAAFRLALAAEPAYQLSDELVSPKVIGLFELARARK